jgi:aspartate aminotransferase
MHLSRRIADLKPLPTTAMHGRVEAMQARGETVIDFSIAISHFPAPEAVIAAARNALGQTILPYTTVAGALGLRAQLAAQLGRDNGIAAATDEVIITNGAKHALYEALYVMADPGQRVLIFKPYWPAYLAVCRLLALEPVLVDLPSAFTPDFLDSLPPADILVINNPHNPTGKVLGAAEADHIASWMRRRGTRAIVDESYEKLLFAGRHRSLAARPDWQALGIVTLLSCSQSYAMMGWRAGLAVAPRAIISAMETVQGPITAAAPALTQLALAAAFANGTPPDMLEDYRQRRDIVLNMMSEIPWLKPTCPDAGPYLWADISPLGVDGVRFTEDLLAQEAVALMPGEALGVANHIRLGFIGGDRDVLRRGVQAIIRFGDCLYANRQGGR